MTSTRYSAIAFTVVTFFFATSGSALRAEDTWIRINQVGYLPHSIKVAVLGSLETQHLDRFEIRDASTGGSVWASDSVRNMGAYGPFASTFRLYFSEFRAPGEYYIETEGARSPAFTIGYQVYEGAADFLLRYMRQQRCGYNPFLKDSCHTRDGFTVYGPMPDGTHVDVTGGWHDAADYLQYVTTSANATFNLLFAYRDNARVFADEYNELGLPSANGVADVLDEAKWGLDWLLKMFPADSVMFHQIADDRDHAGFRLPNEDTVDYGRDAQRPVYFCSGEVQGLGEYKNRTEGVASTAGKFSSAFALAASLYRAKDPAFADSLLSKAQSAYEFGRAKPGACQTAPCRAPYFYEEDNWVDDMELAAAELFSLFGDPRYREEALSWGRRERVTPWIGADSARHYQWYPFLNKGHYELAAGVTGEARAEVISFYLEGIRRIGERGRENAFLMGVPFIWCSNNLVAAFATQCYLYRKLSGDRSYEELETAMRDWLFGVNPWGVSMVIGLPENGIYARHPHSSLAHLHGYKIDGGLLDGPVYGSIYRNQQYVQLTEEDEYATFQSDLAVYHNDVGDYATNEPTMDGTATLLYYLAGMAKEGRRQRGELLFEHRYGGIVRGDRTKRSLALAFTGDEYADGAVRLREILTKHSVKGSFFLTGKFYRNLLFRTDIELLLRDGHYLGPHSDAHLLYCSWEDRDSLLVTREEFFTDLENNYRAMEKFGLAKTETVYFLPAYEWYNAHISAWAAQKNVQLVNYTPGTLSHADYTIPAMTEGYRDSETILRSIYHYERNAEHGLNGFILLSHIGTHPKRTDKFYERMDELIEYLLARGYTLVRIDELLH